MEGKMTFDDLFLTFSKYLVMDELEPLLKVTIATVLNGEKGDGEPLWIWIIAPPSSGKTAVVTTFDGSKCQACFVSSFTRHTLASGWRDFSETSLLQKLGERGTIIVKDASGFLKARAELRAEIFSQLAEVYDGRYDKLFGNGKEVHWSGRMNFIMCSTEIVELSQTMLSEIGARFLMLRVGGGPRDQQAELAAKYSDVNIFQDLKRAMNDFLDERLQNIASAVPQITIPQSIRTKVAKLAELVSWCRAPVLRDPVNRTILDPLQPEGPARLTKQLLALLRFLPVVAARNDAIESDYIICHRVATDSIPKNRLKILDLLYQLGPLPISVISANCNMPEVTCRRAAEELRYQQLVVTSKHGKRDSFELSAKAGDLISDCEPNSSAGAVSGKLAKGTAGGAP
jgi:predicted transcriptional regulator